MKAVDKGVNYEQNGVSAILADNTVPIRLFGQHFTNQTIVRFVRDVKSRGTECDETDATEAYAVIIIIINFYCTPNIVNIKRVTEK